MSLLSRKALLLAKNEAVFNQEEILDASADAILAADQDYQVDESVLERNFTQASLSVQRHVIGRKIAQMTFQTELRGNGKQSSGVLGDEPIITRLFRGCGLSLTAMGAPEATKMFDVGEHANVVSWVPDDSTLATEDVIAYYLEVTTGGPSATAQITVTSDTTGEGNAAAVVTSGSSFTIGASGLTATPTFSGDLAVGQRWVIWALPTGFRMDPVSDNFESVTSKMFFDGLEHKMTGSMGTFTINAQGGQFANVQFDFQGQYFDPVDTPLPSATFEKTKPRQVELARMRLQEFSAVVETFSLNVNNDIQPRLDANRSDAFDGVRIVGRSPEGGLDPEAALVADNDFWKQFSAADAIPFQMRVGTERGNTVWILAPGIQYTGLTYQDRNGFRTFDAGLKFPQFDGDDEFIVCFI